MTRRLDHPLIAKLALLWLSAERAAKVAVGQMIANDVAQEMGDDPKLIAQEALIRTESVKIGNARTDDDMAIAVDRVAMVLAGEVRWSEAGPGDRAVWKARFRDVEKFTQWWRHEREVGPKSGFPRDEQRDTEIPWQPVPPGVGPKSGFPRDEQRDTEIPWQSVPPGGRRLTGYRERFWVNYYDTLRINHSTPNGTRMFGSQNIGNQFLTNMQMPGQIAGDSTFVILAFYAAISNIDALSFFADNVLLELVIGNSPRLGPIFGRDAFMGIPLSPPVGRPLIVPVRQNWSVAVHWRTHNGRAVVMPDDIDFDLTVHLEGLRTRDIV